MNFSDEEYVRLYTTDTVTWDMLPWQAHALLALGLRKFDRSGVFDFGKHGAERALVSKTKLPVEVVSVGLKALLDEEVWTLEPDRLFWPQYIEAQTCKRSDRIRQREARARRASEPERPADSRQRTDAKDSGSSCDNSHVSSSTRDASHDSQSVRDNNHVSSHASQNVTLGEAREGEGRQGILLSGTSDARAHITAAPRSAAKRSNGLTKAPESIDPTEATLAVSARTRRDWRADWQSCRDWAWSGNKLKADWQATLRNWMTSNAQKYGPSPGFVAPKPKDTRPPRPSPAYEWIDGQGWQFNSDLAARAQGRPVASVRDQPATGGSPELKACPEPGQAQQMAIAEIVGRLC